MGPARPPGLADAEGDDGVVLGHDDQQARAAPDVGVDGAEGRGDDGAGHKEAAGLAEHGVARVQGQGVDVAQVIGGEDGEVGKVGEQEEDGDKGHGDPDGALEVPLGVAELAEAEVDVVEAVVLLLLFFGGNRTKEERLKRKS